MQVKSGKCSVKYQSQDGLFLIVRIDIGGIVDDYLVKYITSPYVFTMEKLEPGRTITYTCIWYGEEGEAPYCGCDQYKNNGMCDHLEMIHDLIEQGIFN